MKKIVLVDISTILHRVRLSTKGEKYGVALLSTLDTLKRTFRGYDIHFIQDFGGSRYRKELSDIYKAHRTEKIMTEDEERKLAEFRKWNSNLDLFYPFLKCYKIFGVEADDIICTLYTRLKEQGYEVKCCTIDKDFMTSIPVEDLYNLSKQRFFNQEDDRKGLTRKQFKLFQGLLGDQTDNVNGICGEKTAIVLANNFSSYKAMREFEGDVNNLVGLTSHNKRYIIKALESLKEEEIWEELKLTYNLINIFTDSSKYSEKEWEEYLEIENKIVSDEEVEYVISEDLEDFLEEMNEIEVLYLIEEML